MSYRVPPIPSLQYPAGHNCADLLRGGLARIDLCCRIYCTEQAWASPYLLSSIRRATIVRTSWEVGWPGFLHLLENPQVIVRNNMFAKFEQGKYNFIKFFMSCDFRHGCKITVCKGRNSILNFANGMRSKNLVLVNFSLQIPRARDGTKHESPRRRRIDSNFMQSSLRRSDFY
jgi:hypothetical protein